MHRDSLMHARLCMYECMQIGNLSEGAGTKGD